jgi:hypothetical protein
MFQYRSHVIQRNADRLKKLGAGTVRQEDGVNVAYLALIHCTLRSMFRQAGLCSFN